MIKNNWRWFAWSLLFVASAIIADEVSRMY